MFGVIERSANRHIEYLRSGEKKRAVHTHVEPGANKGKGGCGGRRSRTQFIAERA